MRKYVVHPGYVISKNDGQKHYVGFLQLVNLYKVNKDECIDASNFYDHSGDFIHLWPSSSGRYRLMKG